MANALPILLLGGAALLMMGGKKKNKVPSLGDMPVPPAPTNAVAVKEQSFVDIVFDVQPKYHYLGNQAVVKKVSGVDAEGFVYPLANEALANWYTRVAYWGAYPYAPYEIPPQCMAPDLAEKLGIPCDPGFIPHRDALLRIYGLVIAEGKRRGEPMDARAGSNA